jgi:hypothetical protein
VNLCQGAACLSCKWLKVVANPAPFVFKGLVRSIESGWSCIVCAVKIYVGSVGSVGSVESLGLGHGPWWGPAGLALLCAHFLWDVDVFVGG